jgi:uncharacterized repeat protein (TIGR01451 family)
MRRGARGCVGAILLVALIGSLGSGQLHATIRGDEPVLVPGGVLADLNGIPIADFGLFKYDSGTQTFVPIPFQLDERVFTVFNPGDTELEFSQTVYDVKGLDDGLLDADDELAFLFKDAGPQEPGGTTWPVGAGQVRYEIRVTDPRPGAPVTDRWVYLFSGSALPASPVQYVSWNLSRFTSISTPEFAMDYQDVWLLTGYRALACGSGADLIDRLKTRAGLDLDQAESEEDWNISSFFGVDWGAHGPGGILGPVRAIRYVRGAASGVNTLHHDIVYEKQWFRTVDLRVHSLGPAIWHYLDWLPQAGTTLYSPSQAAGVPIDGVLDGPLNSPLEDWHVISGPGGGMVVQYDIPPSPFYTNKDNYFRDDATYDDTPIANPGYPDEDDSAYGNHGWKVGPITTNDQSDNIPIFIKIWPQCSNVGDATLGAAYQELTDNPLQLSATSQMAAVNPVVLTARRDGADVVLEWQAIPDATSYRVFRSSSASQPKGLWTLLAEVPGTDYRDVGNAGPPDHYYYVAAVGPTVDELTDLTLIKSVDNPTPSVGSTVVFTVTVSNASAAAAATGVLVSDPLPTGYAHVSDDSGGAYNPSTGVWSAGSIPAGGSAILNVTARVLGNGLAGDYLNTAEVIQADLPDKDDIFGDGSGNDADSVSTTPVPTLDLSLNKVADNSVPVVGTNVVFSLTLQNAIDFSDATGVVVTDLLPSGFIYVSDDAAGSSTTYDSLTGLWTVGPLSAGGGVTLNITARVRGTGDHSNVAEVTAADQPDTDDTYGDGSGNDYDAVTPTPDPRLDLSLTKTVDNGTPGTGTNVVFTVTVSNGADYSDATGVQVTDLLPTGYTWVSDDSGGAYNPVTGLWGAGSISAGSSAVLNITAQVQPAGDYLNVAEVTAADQLDANDTYGEGAGDDHDTASTAPVPTVDLSLTKTVDNATPAVGSNVVFTLTVSNAAGFSDATGVVVTDLLPSGYAHVSDDSGGAYDSGTGIWTVGSVASGSNAVLNITARVQPVGAYLNVAEVTAANEPDANDIFGDGVGDDHDTAATTPTATLDLSLSKTVDNAVPLVGSNVVFSVTVSNAAGFSDATGLQVTDLLPSGYAYVSDDSAGSGTTYDELTGLWTIGALTAGNGTTLNITALVRGTGDHLNVAEVTAADQPDADDTYGNGSGNDYAAAPTTPSPVIDLSLTKTVDVAAPPVGSNVVFRVSVSNGADYSDATGVEVTDLLPSGYSYASDDSASTGTTYDSLSGLWSVGALAAGASIDLNITARVEPVGDYLNVAEVTAAGQPDADDTFGNGMGNDHDTALTTPVVTVDLSLTKSVDNGTPAVGANVIFTITVSNAAGFNDASGVLVADLLPSGYVYVSDNGGGSYVPGTGVWTVGTLPSGNNAVLNITARVRGTGDWVNVAEVTAADQPDADDTFGDGGGNDHDTAPTTPSPVIDLALTKTVDNATPAVGSNVVFTVTVSNAADYSDAGGVQVTDLLPSGYTYLSDDAGGNYNSTAGVWTVGALAAGNNAVLNLTARVQPSGDYLNVAEVTAANEPDADDIFGNGAGDDHDTATTTPVATVDLSLAKVVDDPAPAVGSNVVFTLTVANESGFSDAGGVVVTDLLPGGYSHVGDDGGGAYNPATGVWTVGAVAGGSSAVLNITAGVNPTGNYTNSGEVTAADQPDTDSAPNNGVTTEDDYAEVSTTPVPVADLSLAKVVDNATPDVGSNVVFTLTVSNAGPSDATGVAVTDLLPTGYTYVSDDSAGAYNSVTGVWTVGGVAASGNAVLNITASVNPSGAYTNTSEVTAAGESDPDSTPSNGVTTEDDYAEATTTPVPIADLSLAKVVDNATPDVGSNVVFTLTVSNAGPSDATVVSATDLLPTGYTYVSDDSAGAYNSVTGVWTVGGITASGNAVLNITASVNPGGDYTNAAEVTAAGESDPDSTPNNGVTSEDDYAEVSTAPVPSADLSLTKTVDAATPDVGSNVVFTLTVSNAGPSDASGVQATDLLPSGYTYVSDDSGGAYNPVSGLWTVGSLASSSSAVLNITARVRGTGDHLNAAELTGAGESDPDSTPNNGVTTEDDYAEAPTTPNAVIDLSLAKVVDQATPDVGSTVVFTLTVTNDPDFSNATGVIVRDKLPGGYAYISDDSASSGTSYNPGNGRWNMGSLSAGASLALNLTASVNPAGDYLNTSEVFSAGQTDTDSTPNNEITTEDDYAEVATVPVPVADLSLAKVVDNAAPDVGSNVVFTLTVSNAGPSDATGVTVTDLLPAGYTYVSDDGAGAYNSGTGVWTVAGITASGSAVLNITASVNPSGEYTNSAEVTAAGESDPDSTPNNGVTTEDDYAEVSTTPVPVADLSLVKVVDNATPDIGSNVVFTLTVTNDGPSDATGVAVTDLLPTGYTYVSDDSAGAYNSVTGVWTVGGIPASDNAVLNITASVNPNGDYTNTAEVTAAGESDPDSTPNNGVTTEDDYAEATTTPVLIADLSLTKVVDNSTPDVGSNLVFTLTVSNAGPSDATGVSVTDLLPTGYTYVSDDSAGAYDSGTGVWTVGGITASGSAVLNITASVNAGGDYTNTAEVTAAGESDPDSTPNNGVTTEDDYAEVTTTPVPVADLSLSKVVDNATPDVGGNVVFTLTVTNDGPSDATGVSVTDFLPTGYTYVSDDGAGAYNSGTGVWTVGGITAGGNAVLNITASVNTSGDYTNTAEVTAAGESDPDSTPNNGVTTEDDYAEATTTPVQVADLALAKVVDNATPDVGGNVVFTLTVTNGGPSDATGVTVTDLLPTGYTYVSDDGAGAYNSGTGVWTVGGVTASGSAVLNITASVNPNGDYTNTAEVTAAGESDPDSTPNNGVTTEDDYAEATTTPVQIADLSLAKVVDNATPDVGSNVVFTLTVTNDGPSDATGVSVTDLLPAGYTYVSDDSAGAYNSGTGVWTVGGITSSGNAVLNITASVNASGDYTNTAEVTAAGESDPDSIPNNGVTTEDDYAEATTTPVQVADLALVKVVDNATPDVGGNVVFTLTVTNDGPSSQRRHGRDGDGPVADRLHVCQRRLGRRLQLRHRCLDRRRHRGKR